MPIQILELIIRATVEDSRDNGHDELMFNPVARKNEFNNEEIDTDAIVTECVEQVMQILAKNRER